MRAATAFAEDDDLDEFLHNLEVLYPRLAERRDAIKRASDGRTSNPRDLSPAERKRALKPRVSRDTPDMLEAALAYARDGTPVLPIYWWESGCCSCGDPKCDSPAKHPLVPGGHKSGTTDLKQIEKWFKKWPNANIATCPGDTDCMVVDCDPGSDEDAFPDTDKWATTPRDGAHLWYGVSKKEFIPNSASKVAPHVDIRGHNGYVLLPPSRTKDGEYKWESKARPAPAPSWLIEKAKEAGAKERHRDADVWRIEPDQPEHVAAAREAAAGRGPHALRPAIEGQGGDHATYAAAAMMRSLGLEEGMALEVLAEHFNPRCEPPWDHDDLETKVRNAYSYATSVPGNLTEEYHRKKAKLPVLLDMGKSEDEAWEYLAKKKAAAAAEAPPEADADPEGSYVIPGLYDGPIAYSTRPPATWIIPGLIEEAAYTIHYGGSYVGKSFVAVNLALCIATGQPFMGMEIAKPGTVLYIVAEGQNFFGQRVAAACEELGIDPVSLTGRLFIYDRPAKLNTAKGEAALDMILEQIEERTGAPPVLVIVDTIRRNHAGSVSSEDDVSPTLDKIVELTGRGISAYLIGHMAKGNTGDEPKGLTDWLDNADTGLMQTGDTEAGWASLKVVKQKNSPSDWHIHMKFQARGDSLVLVHDAAKPPERARGSSVKELVKDTMKHPRWAEACEAVLLKSGRRMSRSELAREVADYILAKDGIRENSETIRTTFIIKADSAAKHEPPALIRHLCHPGTKEFSHPDAVKAAGRLKRIGPSPVGPERGD